MEDLIQRTMKSKNVTNIMNRLSITEKSMIELWFESGIEFIEGLETRIRHKRTFDAQFKLLLRDRSLGNNTPQSLFAIVKKSPAFWSWWGTMLWCTCEESDIASKAELQYRMRHDEKVIPFFILQKIFYGEKECSTAARVADYFAAKASATGKRTPETV